MVVVEPLVVVEAAVVVMVEVVVLVTVEVVVVVVVAFEVAVVVAVAAVAAVVVVVFSPMHASLSSPTAAKTNLLSLSTLALSIDLSPVRTSPSNTLGPE